MAYLCHEQCQERTCLMSLTITENEWNDKVCHQIDLGMVQEVIPPSCIEELLDTYQMWEERERKTNMLVIVYWLIALHLYPTLSQRRVYGKLVSGLRTMRDDVPEAIPVRSAFSYRREQVGSELMQELFRHCAGPQASQEKTPDAFWKGMRLLAIDGTVESVADTPSNRASFRYSSDEDDTRSPFPQARLVLLVECGTHLICDAELSSCRQAEAHALRLVLERWSLEQSLLLWDSGFHANSALFAVRQRGGHVLGRLAKHMLLKPLCGLVDGSYLTYLYHDHRQRGERMLVRVISYTFTDPRIPGAGVQVYRLVTTLLDPFLYPAKELAVLYHERWHAELVIDETRTHLRLSARTLRSLTPEGVIQEIYALLLAHLVVRTLMLRAAEQAHLSAHQLSFTETIRILDETLLPLGLVAPARREHMVQAVLSEISQQRLPKQGVRIQARVVKRVRSRYERKKPEHWHVPPLELDLCFHDCIALVT
jgi:hypothetical protein